MNTVYKFGGSPDSEKEERKIIDKMSNDFVLKDGGTTLTGTLDMGVNKISRVVDPGDAQDAATKKYVDDELTKNVMKVIQNPLKKLTVSTEDGNVEDTDLSVDDVVRKSAISELAIPKLQSPVGGKFLVSTSEGNIAESDAKPIFYTSVTNSNSITNDYIRADGQHIDKLSLPIGVYRITLNCVLEKTTEDIPEVLWVSIYEKDDRNKHLTFRAFTFKRLSEYFITFSVISHLRMNIEDTKIRLVKDGARNAVIAKQSCDFVLEKL